METGKIASRIDQLEAMIEKRCILVFQLIEVSNKYFTRHLNGNELVVTGTRYETRYFSIGSLLEDLESHKSKLSELRTKLKISKKQHTVMMKDYEHRRRNRPKSV